MGKENAISDEVIAKVTDYVVKNYPNYKDTELFITGNDSVFFINKHKDGSPLILSKGILG